jgi:hypothetical protein
VWDSETVVLLRSSPLHGDEDCAAVI